MTPSAVIDGVTITPLKQMVDERGKVMHMLSRDAPHFRAFGEIYFSCVHSGKIKAWHRHTRMTLNYAVPHGRIHLVLYDDREESPTRGRLFEMTTGPEDDYVLITIPPLVWNGFQGRGDGMSIVANCATIPHDPDEIVRLDPFDAAIPYQWTSGLR